ncbi:hypothetical protein S245_009029, partial [Arachis hypogaea]
FYGYSYWGETDLRFIYCAAACFHGGRDDPIPSPFNPLTDGSTHPIIHVLTSWSKKQKVATDVVKFSAAKRRLSFTSAGVVERDKRKLTVGDGVLEVSLELVASERYEKRIMIREKKNKKKYNRLNYEDSPAGVFGERLKLETNSLRFGHKFTSSDIETMEASLEGQSYLDVPATQMVHEQLWADKYAPKSFTELLSDEQTNREVLLWTFLRVKDFYDTWAFLDARVKDAFDLKKTIQE